MSSDKQKVDSESALKFTNEEAKQIFNEFAKDVGSSFELDFYGNFDELNYESESDISTNLNLPDADDSAISNTRFPNVSLDDTDKFLLENINKNTMYKTKADVKIFKDWLMEAGEVRDFTSIPAPELDSYLARFYLGVRKKDKTEYEPDSITSIGNSIDRLIYCLK